MVTIFRDYSWPAEVGGGGWCDLPRLSSQAATQYFNENNFFSGPNKF
jgi:hypothetical protein